MAQKKRFQSHRKAGFKPNRYNPNAPDWRAVHAPWSKAGLLAVAGRK